MVQYIIACVIIKHGKILKMLLPITRTNCMQQGTFEEADNFSSCRNLSHFMKTAGALTGSLQPASFPYRASSIKSFPYHTVL